MKLLGEGGWSLSEHLTIHFSVEMPRGHREGAHLSHSPEEQLGLVWRSKFPPEAEAAFQVPKATCCGL
jgi:hypothetical protein